MGYVKVLLVLSNSRQGEIENLSGVVNNVSVLFNEQK